MKPTLIIDTEVYRNYFLLTTLDAESGRIQHFEMFPGCEFNTRAVRRLFQDSRLVSFNGNHFDLPLLAMALRGDGCAAIKDTAERIIVSNMKPWQLGIESLEVDHIDLIEVAPGFVSLKTYGGRLHVQTIQDLPIDPAAEIRPEEREELRDYCANDCLVTQALFEKLSEQIRLREKMGEQFGVDLRSRSDAQIAETVIKLEVERKLGRQLPKRDPFHLAGQTFRYKAPAFIRFETPRLQKALEKILVARFVVGHNGVVQMPEELASLEIKLGVSTYRMGIGGLHSCEKTIAHQADADVALIDRDVASYYPAIILNCGFYPSHMGKHFSEVYRSLVDRRLAAKRAGDKVAADSLKIVINGAFGKLGSPYSVLYSPDLLIQVTLTGQLSLLMLIESLEQAGINVISANTDGVVVRCPRARLKAMQWIFTEWELLTGFETEETRYTAVYSRDVNNYIAIREGGGHKLKGVYAPAGLQKNPDAEICVDAVLRYLVDGAGLAQTIKACKDVRKFVTIRSVKTGAMKGDEFLGRTARWYYAIGERGAITYRQNGNKVANSDGARPLMVLPKRLPAGIDLERYAAMAAEILADIGAIEKPAQQLALAEVS